jgi:hypothetical protein
LKPVLMAEFTKDGEPALALRANASEERPLELGADQRESVLLDPLGPPAAVLASRIRLPSVPHRQTDARPLRWKGGTNQRRRSP